MRTTGEARGTDGERGSPSGCGTPVDGFVRREALAFSAAPSRRPARPAALDAAAARGAGPFPLDATALARTGWEFAAAPDGPGVGP